MKTNKKVGFLTVAIAIMFAISGIVVIGSDDSSANTDKASYKGTPYESINAAIAAFEEDSATEGTITLLDDVKYNPDYSPGGASHIIKTTKKLTINGGDHTITFVENDHEGLKGSPVLIIGDVTISNATIKSELTGPQLFFVEKDQKLTLDTVILSEGVGHINLDENQYGGNLTVKSSNLGNSTIIAYGDGKSVIPTIDIQSTTGVNLNVVNSNFTLGTNLKVDADSSFDTITFYTDSTFTVPKDTVLKANTITTDDDGTKPSIIVEQGGTVDAALSSNITFDNGNNTNRMAIGSTLLALEGDLIIVGDAYIIESLTIPEGKKVIVRNGGVLDLNGKKLTIEGELIVETGGIIKDIGGGSITLDRNGVLDNSGVIGYGNVAVEVNIDITDKTYVGFGKVTMKNASGVSFGIASTGDVTADNPSKPVYVLTVTGDVTSTGTGTSAISIEGARIVGDMTIGQEVTLMTNSVSVSLKDSNNNDVTTYKVNLMPKAVLTIDGTLGTTNDALIMNNNSEVVINGIAQGKIFAATGKFAVNASVTGTTSVDLYGVEAQTGYVTGIILSVGQISYMEGTTKFIEQRLSITGTSDLVAKGPATTSPVGIITIDNTGGISIIPAESTLVIDEGIAFTGDSTTVLGQIQYPVKNGTSVSGIVGSEYIIVNADKSKTGYIMPFADAIKNIASADNTTVTVYGDVSIEEGFTLTDKQKVILDSSATKSEISDKATVELLKGSSISNKFSKVTGVLRINTGASCTAPTAFEVLKKTTDYIEYSGLAVALDNAKAGETITIKSSTETTVKKDLTVAEGVTLVIASDVTANKNITIADGAKLVIQDNKTLTMDNAISDASGKYKLTVNGILDASDGNIAIPDSNDKIYSTGELIYKSGSFATDIKAYVNGFAYDDEEGNTVVTTLLNAVAKASVQDINNDSVSAYGTVTETEDVKLDGINLVIENNAKITLGNVSINEAQISCSAVPGGSAPAVKIGSYAATVSGLDGVGDEAADGTVKVKDYTSTITQNSIPGASGVTTYNLTINTVVGEVEIVSGSAKLGSDYTIASKSILAIDEGATLLSDYASAAFSTDDAVIKVDGTLKVVKDLAITTVKDNILVINGTLNIIGATATIQSNVAVSVIGSIIIEKNADGDSGKLQVNNNLVSVGTPIKSTGATASISGAVTLGSGNYITAYAGSDMSAAVIDGTTGYASTAYTVNGVDYATVYAKKTNEVKISDAISATGLTIDGYDATGAVWKNVEGKEVTNSDCIGSISTVDAQLTPGNAKIIYSAGTGISLWVDGIRVSSSTEPVSIALGTHTVVAKVNPGYKGDVTMTFNGQKVTDGKIVITADMTKTGAANVVLSATGDISIDNGSSSDSSSSDDGMGITDYLLIVLVVLAAILVVIVALRMMRS